MLDNETRNKITEILRKKEPVVIISHINPDGDSIGSSLALALFIRKMGVPVTVIIPNEVPDFLKWLPGFEMICIYTLKKRQCNTLVDNAGAIFLVDFNDPERTGGLKKALMKSEATKILIDHHVNPVMFTDIIISETWRGSAGEMIFLMLKELEDEVTIDKDIATCLYVAIITDTGNFRYSSSYAEIFTIAGKLIEYGIEKNEIFTNIYDSYSEERMKLMGYCMSEKLVVLKKYNTAYISLTAEELERFNHQVGDTEGFVNIPFSIKNIEITALFIEKKNHVKISLRSKGSFSVDQLATAHFKGGGHINAAGGESDLSLSETIQKFETIIADLKNEN